MAGPLPFPLQMRSNPTAHANSVGHKDCLVSTSLEPIKPLFIPTPRNTNDFAKHGLPSYGQFYKFIGSWGPGLCAPENTTAHRAVEHSQASVDRYLAVEQKLAHSPEHPTASGDTILNLKPGWVLKAQDCSKDGKANGFRQHLY